MHADAPPRESPLPLRWHRRTECRDTVRGRHPNRHIWLELPDGPGHLERDLLSGRAAAGAGTFDELAYYAEHFDTVEVNSSFYRAARSAVTRSWAARTPPGFDFSLKLYQKFTHPGMYQGRTRRICLPTATRRRFPRSTRADVDAFKSAVDPLADAGKLGALLAQFPPSFRDRDDAREYLEWLLQAFQDYPLAVELRHRAGAIDDGRHARRC